MKNYLQHLATITLALLISTTAFAQTATTDAPQPSAAEVAASQAKAETILQEAIKAMGGAAYTNVISIVGRGRFTPYDGGISGAPFRFADYVLYPDKNRTEFYGRGNRVIQVNSAQQGWVFDAAARKIDDAKPDQLADYNFSLRTSIDGLLRGAWRTSGQNKAALSYVGRREASLGQRNETVRLTYADGFTVDFEFGARDRLPAKVSYKRQRKVENKEGIEEPVEIAEEDRFAQFIETSGVRLPFVVDHFRGGIQTSRVNYEDVSFNENLPEEFFQRPANIKSIKERKKK